MKGRDLSYLVLSLTLLLSIVLFSSLALFHDKEGISSWLDTFGLVNFTLLVVGPVLKLTQEILVG
jgi:hypothetical protein